MTSTVTDGVEARDWLMVEKAAMVAIIASGVQRGLGPSKIVAELLADEDIHAALSRPQPEGVEELVKRLRKYDWHIHTSQGSKRTDIPLRAADMIESLARSRPIDRQQD